MLTLRSSGFSRVGQAMAVLAVAAVLGLGGCGLLPEGGDETAG